MDKFFPSTLDVDHVVSKSEHLKIAGLKEKIIDILDLIITFSSYADRADENGFISIPARYFQEIDKKYPKILHLLTQEGIIAIDYHYRVGEKSRGYKLREEYVLGIERENTSEEQSCKKPRLLSSSREKTYKHILQFLDNRLTIRKDAAIKFLVAELQSRNENPELRTYDYVSKAYKNPYSQYICGKVAVENITGGNFRPLIDSTAGRLHSVLTNMPSALRKFLLFDNKPLVSIDINNSQPLMSLLTLKSSFWLQDSSSLSIHDIDSSFIDFIFSSPIFLSSFIMISKREESHNDSDLYSYIDLIRYGKLYEYLEANVFDGAGQRSRKQVKAAVFQIMYTDNRFFGQLEAEPKRRFAKLFPTVHLLLSKLKQRQSNLLPILLQKIESYLVLDVITRRIASKYPTIPLFTIHDSVATTEENVSVVQSVMRDELDRVFGFAPALTIEAWTN